MAKSKIMIDNSRVRVIEKALDYGDETGDHIHGYHYVVVPMNDGILKIFNDDVSITLSKLKQGIRYFRKRVKIITLLMKINFTIVL